MQQKFILAFILLLINIFDSKGQFQNKGLNGVEYSIYSKWKGPKVNEGDFMRMHLIMKLQSRGLDSLFRDSDLSDQVVIEKMEYQDMPAAIKDVMQKVSIGDSLIMKIPMRSMFREDQEMPSFLSNWEFMLFTVQFRELYTTSAEADDAKRKYGIHTTDQTEEEIGANSEVSGSYNNEDAQDLAKTIQSEKVDAPAKIVEEQHVGQTAISSRTIQPETTSTTKDPSDDSPIFVALEQQSQFPGGLDGWRRYLIEHLNADLPTSQGAPSGTYTVVVRFVVNKQGIVSDVIAENNPGYGLAAEAVRVIQNSGKWIPGTQSKKPVSTYKRQPITWVVEEDKPIKTKGRGY